MGATIAATDDPIDTGARHLAPTGRRWWLGVVAIALVGLALRLVYVFALRDGVALIGDPVYYHEGANLLAEGKGFINPFAYSAGDTVQAADHPPLYTLYLAAFSLIGITSVTGHLVASCLLGAASIVLAAIAGREILGRRVGLLAAVLVAIYPNVWRFDGMVLSETMVIFTVLLTVWLAYRCWNRPSISMIAAVAAAIGLTALARSELLLLAPVVLLPLAIGVARRLGISWFKPVGVAVGVSLLVIGPWVAYNLSRFDRPVFLSGQLEVTLTVANCDRTYYGDQIGYWDYTCGQKLLDAHGPVADSAEANQVQLDGTLDYIRANKSRVPVVVAARVGRILGVYRPAQQIDIDSVAELFPRRVMVAATVAYWILVPFSLAGVVLLRRRRVAIYPLIAIPLTVLGTVIVIYASTRFRAAAEGPMCLAAAVGIGVLLARWWPDPELEPEFADGPEVARGGGFPTQDQLEAEPAGPSGQS